MTIHLNMNRFNHKHCHVQIQCGEILTVFYCQDEQILGIMSTNGYMHNVSVCVGIYPPMDICITSVLVLVYINIWNITAAFADNRPFYNNTTITSSR